MDKRLLKTTIIFMSFSMLTAIVSFPISPTSAQQVNPTVVNDSTSINSTGNNVNNTSTISLPIFAFYYKETGGIFPKDIDILYDSISKQLATFGSRLNSTDVFRTELTPIQEMNIQEVIRRNGFFDAQTYYPGEGTDLISYLLTITMDNRSQTIYWNDDSERPEGLDEIASQIKNLPSTQLPCTCPSGVVCVRC